MTSAIDYSIYLVTDTPLVPSGKTLVEQVAKAIDAGATIVQLREKTADTRDFIDRAKEVKQLTSAAGIPLIINDRMDVALAVDADGIHVGQDDIDVATIKKCFPGKIVGLSVNNVTELREAIKERVDYVGIGAVFGTLTKDLKNPPIGCTGVREILDVIDKECDYDLKTVAIGGINQSNVQHVLYSSATETRKLDGVAVVSCIMAAEDATQATKDLAKTFATPGPWVRSISQAVTSIEDIIKLAPQLAAKVATNKPLLHHITNDVVKNFSANISIAAGASPAMSECPDEFDDFAAVPGSALVLNMGTATNASIDMYQKAVKAYNNQGKTIILDPVGCGASSHRRQTIARLLNSGVYDVIKGNEGEITAAARVEGIAMKGVDSVGDADLKTKLATAKKLATENHTTVLLTGKEDVLVDANRALVFRNGHEHLARITGSGCVLGSLVAAFVSVHPNDPLAATAGALLIYTLASERVIDCTGPGTFIPHLIDSIHRISQLSLDGDFSWVSPAKLQEI